MPPHDLPGAPTMSASSPRFDQFDLRQMFASVRSLAVVGNAATILDYENGALIDNYDMVVRFNRAQVTGVEHKIGRRTDLLVANETNSLALAPSPADTLAPRCVLSFILRGPDFDITPFRTWVGDHTPCLCLVPPDIIGFPQQGRTRLLSHGTYAIYLLTQILQLERLFVTGFTMFGTAPGGAQKYYGPGDRKAGTYHDLDQEPKLFCAILAAFPGELRVTAEVDALLQRYGVHTQARLGSAVGTPAQRLTVYEQLQAGLARRLLRWGTRLRHAVEKSNQTAFRNIKR